MSGTLKLRIQNSLPQFPTPSLQKHEQAKSDVNRRREQSRRLTTGSFAVYSQFISETASDLSSWLLTSGPSPCFPYKPFSYKACPGIFSCVSIRRASLLRQQATTASWHASSAGITGFSSHVCLHLVAQLVTFNDQLANENIEVVDKLIEVPIESKTRTYHSGSGRSARRSGRAGSGKIGCQQNYSPRKQRSTVPSKASKKRRFNVSPLLDLSNPKPGHTTGRSSRGGARRGGGAAGRGGAGAGRDAVGSIWPGDNPPSFPPAKKKIVLDVSSEARTV